MKMADLKRINEAPESGQMLAYTREKVFFKPYLGIDEVKEEFTNQNLLELHLFDRNKEYRAIASESVRYRMDGYVDTVSDFRSDEKDESGAEAVYSESVLLENGGRITVLNHLKFDEETGMAYVDDYRLVMEDVLERDFGYFRGLFLM